MKDEALKLALEALEAATRYGAGGFEDAKDALRAAQAAQPAPVQEPVAYRPTGWAAHRDQYAVPVLFNPYTGQPRDVRDVQSDPQGILIVPPGKVEMLAAKPTVKQSLQVATSPAAQPALVQEPVAHPVIAGALFDFMGWLTSRDQRLTLSSTDEASPAVEAITEFAKMRGLLLDDARVQDWQDNTTPPAAQQTCNCRWEGEVQVQQCTLHQAHVDAIHEWAGRAKAAEAKLAAQPAVPDAFGTREGEHPQYIQGWNDCRAEMLKGMK
jgi:hypothetical protein